MEESRTVIVHVEERLDENGMRLLSRDLRKTDQIIAGVRRSERGGHTRVETGMAERRQLIEALLNKGYIVALEGVNDVPESEIPILEISAGNRTRLAEIGQALRRRGWTGGIQQDPKREKMPALVGEIEDPAFDRTMITNLLKVAQEKGCRTVIDSRPRKV